MNYLENGKYNGVEFTYDLELDHPNIGIIIKNKKVVKVERVICVYDKATNEFLFDINVDHIPFDTIKGMDRIEGR